MLAALAAMLVVLGASHRAHAQDAEAAARARYAEGVRLLDAGDTRAAYTEFEAGYQLSHRPLFLFNMGECARQMGEPDRARRDYEGYLAAEPSGAMSATARRRLAELPAPAASATGPEASSTIPAVALEDSATGPDLRVSQTEPVEEGGGGDDVAVIVLVAVGVAALIGGGIALGVHFGTQGQSCDVGCVDFR
ncbi:MAG: tol-pal system YbgF family protein [Sandaracinaceae bacterium]